MYIAHTEEGLDPGEVTPSRSRQACAASVSDMRSSTTTAESRLAAGKANASRQVDEPEYEMGTWVTVDHTDRFVRYAFTHMLSLAFLREKCCSQSPRFDCLRPSHERFPAGAAMGNAKWKRLDA